MRYKILVWSSQLILWPLLRLLCFVINSVINAWHRLLVNDGFSLMTIVNFWLISCPLVRIFIYRTRWEHIHLALRILCIAHLWRVDVWPVECTCKVRMRSVCKHFLIFPRVFWSLILHFPSCFPFSVIFPCLVFILGFVSPSSFLSLSCVPW